MNQSSQFPTDVTKYVQDTATPQTPAYRDYEKIFNDLIRSFETGEKYKCEQRRDFRRHHINIAEERTKGTILADETKVPDRTIEANVRRDKSPLVQLLVQPTTVLSYTDFSVPGRNFAPLANYYTDMNRQPGWQIEWFYLIDALQIHGASYLEVFFDPNTPLKTNVEYVRRDHLIFPAAARSLDACGHILRRYELTKSQFAEMAQQKGFDPRQVDKINTHYKDRNEFIILHRVFMKIAGIVNVAWTGNIDAVTDDWVLAPAPYDIGLRIPSQTIPGAYEAAPLKSYPIIVFPLDLEEDEVILKTQGRVSLDLHVQDAMTAIISAVVNGSVRASGLYPTRKPDPNGNPPTNQESFVYRHGHMVEGDITFGKMEWPSAVALSIAQFLRTHNASQAGGVDWAAMNRADTAKTATELTLAQKESDSLKGIATTLFMLCALRVELLRWQVWLSQVRAGLAPLPSFALPLGADPAQYPDAIDIFSPSLVPTLSADQQVVRRAEQMTRYMQYWQFVVGSPYQLPMLETMLSEAFPQQFTLWKQQAGMLQQMQQQVAQDENLLLHAFNVLQQYMRPDMLPPEEVDSFKEFLNNLGAHLQQTAQQNANGPAPAGQ